MEFKLELQDNISVEEAELIFKLAQALEDGSCFSEDEQSALKLYAACARAGYVKAYGKIGELLEDGNPSKAILYYKKGASMGDAYSMVQLGCWFEDNGNAGDALVCYQKAAEAGEIEGMYRYGRLTADGDEKLTWLRKAAAGGYMYAPRALGEMYEMKENENLALFWYRQGLELGDERLMERISILEMGSDEEIDVVIEYDDEETM